MGGRRSSSWIRADKREALYRRDGHCCAYCGVHKRDLHKTCPEKPKLTLDHLDGNNANNRPTNLVTACYRCNSSKQGRTLYQWVVVEKKDRALYERVLLLRKRGWKQHLRAVQIENITGNGVRQGVDETIVELALTGERRRVGGVSYVVIAVPDDDDDIPF